VIDGSVTAWSHLGNTANAPIQEIVKKPSGNFRWYHDVFGTKQAGNMLWKQEGDFSSVPLVYRLGKQARKTVMGNFECTEEM